ncbi:MAG: hypothetical protein OXH81_01625 [Gemmatimonadetes bacterium]|nr:hypothetical protein [Gemmatimonadota bacterium]
MGSCNKVALAFPEDRRRAVKGLGLPPGIGLPRAETGLKRIPTPLANPPRRDRRSGRIDRITSNSTTCAPATGTPSDSRT